MVKLMLFAPCERVSVSEGDGSLSILNLLAGIVTALPFPPDQIPSNAVLPLRWSVLTLWKHDNEDAGTVFFQRITLESPSGKEMLSAETSFGLSPTPLPFDAVRGVTQFNAFPAGEQEGCLSPVGIVAPHLQTASFPRRIPHT
jgi:hypothetical protein